MSQIAGMYEVGNAGAYTDTGVPIRPAQMSGVLGNVVTMARTRGFSSPNTSIIILDEYQKRKATTTGAVRAWAWRTYTRRSTATANCKDKSP